MDNAPYYVGKSQSKTGPEMHPSQRNSIDKESLYQQNGKDNAMGRNIGIGCRVTIKHQDPKEDGGHGFTKY